MIIIRPIDVSQITRALDDAAQRQIPAAHMMALTAVTQRGQALVKEQMARVFDRPTPFTIRGVRVSPATKQHLQASIFLQGQGGRTKFLEPGVDGGRRYMKGFETLLQARFAALQGLQAVPAKGQPLDAYGNLPSGLYNKILSSVKAQRDAYTQTTEKSLTRRIRSGKAVDFFVGRPNQGTMPLGVYSRSYKLVPASQGRVRAARNTTVTKAFGDKKMGKNYIHTTIAPVLVFVRPAVYKPRLSFHAMVQQLVEQQYGRMFQEALTRALATARR